MYNQPFIKAAVTEAGISIKEEIIRIMLTVTLESRGLEIAVKNSLDALQSDLKQLLEHAKDRFPDIVWEHEVRVEGGNGRMVRIWGHKAMIYARTSPKYHALHLYARNNVSYSKLPYTSISSIKDLEDSFSSKVELKSSIFLGPTMVHLKVPQRPNILVRNLHKIYFSFDSQEDIMNGDSQNFSPGLSTLQRDLLFAWSTRLSSDIRLQVALGHDEIGVYTRNGTYIFWSHRFILASRSPYFLEELRRLAEAENSGMTSKDVQILALPSSHFTAVSLFFTLAFIYTGTLDCFNKTYNLEQAFAIYKSAKFLKISSLVTEIRARIAEEFLHGLFNASWGWEEYKPLVARKWDRMVELGGCVCAQCVSRLPQILDFSFSTEIDDTILGRGARRAAVAMFGEGWCSLRFTQLPMRICQMIMNDMSEFITPDNLFPLLFASERALHKLNNLPAYWTETVKRLVITVRDMLDGILLAQPEFCFECEEWMEIMHVDRVGGIGDTRVQEEEMGWICDAILRSSRRDEAGGLYKALVLSVLLRRHPIDKKTLFLPRSSYVRTRITDLLKQFSPLNIALPRFSKPDLDPNVPSEHDDDLNRSVSVRIHRASQISEISIVPKYPQHPQLLQPDSTSISTAAEGRRSMRLSAVSAQESNETHIYSYPSSRTTSTYYGYYYTRRALSMETNDGRNMALRRSASWSSFSSRVGNDSVDR